MKHIAKIVTIANQKGGVGKSTTADFLAEGLALKGKRALLVDLDSQQSITLTAGADPDSPTSYELMLGQASAKQAVQKREGRSDILPASRSLALLDTELTGAGRERRLRGALEPILDAYDYVVLDTPPSLGIVTLSALTAADLLVIPAQADLYSLQGISQLYETVEAVRGHTNQALELAGILLTRHQPRTILSRDMSEAAAQAAEAMGTFLYKAFIREGVAVKEAQASQESIYAYAPKSKAALGYMSFVEEFLERGF